MLRRWPTCFQIFRLNSTATNNFNSAPEEISALYNLQQTEIDDARKSIPALATVPTDVWHKTHTLFSEYGFKTKNFMQIIANNPKLLTRSSIKVHESLEFWRGCQFGENRVENLLLRFPTLLDISRDRKIELVVNTLRDLVNTPKNVWYLIMNSPNLLQEDPKSIEEKFYYMQDTMRLEVSEIVKSEAFSYTLDEIKTRHIFLERLGLFKPRSPKAAPGDISKNPRLHLIMDPSENKFATKVALVTLAEYEAFKELYRRELDQGRRRKEDEESDDE